MKINLNLLPITIDEMITIPEYYYDKTDIIDMKSVKVEGIIKNNLSNETELILSVSGEMVLEDAITTDRINYPFSLEIDEILEELEEESEKYFEKNQNTLDIIEFLWENIVLEVPISVTNFSGIHKEGEGWELNSNHNADDEIDPRMQKLNEIFKGGE